MIAPSPKQALSGGGKGVRIFGWMDRNSSQDDRALVDAALRDRHAYAAIVVRYEHMLARYVRRLLGRHAQAADDVLQEVFIKAYVNLNDYDKARPFGPWIYRIAHNEAIGFLRKRRAQPQVLDGEDGLRILDRIAADVDVNEKADLARLDQGVRAAMHELGQKYRDVLVLRYLEQKSYDDIADILELPPGTVATRIKRGLQRLRASLQRSGTDLGAFHRDE